VKVANQGRKATLILGRDGQQRPAGRKEGGSLGDRLAKLAR